MAHALGDRLYGIRLDTPSERGRVTADLVHEVRARLDQAGFQHVKITVSGGLTPGADRVLQGGRRAGRLVRRRARTSAARRRSTSPATSRRSTGSRSPSAAGSRADRLAAPAAGRPGGLPRGRSRRAGARTAPDPCHHRRWSHDPSRPTTRDAPTTCSSAARRCSTGAITRRRRSSSSAPTGSSRARARSSRRSAGRTSTPARPSGRAATFEALLEIDPSSHYGHFALGQSLKRLGRRRPRRGRTCASRSRSARTIALYRGRARRGSAAGTAAAGAARRTRRDGRA